MPKILVNHARFKSNRIPNNRAMPITVKLGFLVDQSLSRLGQTSFAHVEQVHLHSIILVSCLDYSFQSSVIDSQPVDHRVNCDQTVVKGHLGFPFGVMMLQLSPHKNLVLEISYRCTL